MILIISSDTLSHASINAPANHNLLKRIDAQFIKYLDEKNYIKMPLEISAL